MKQTSERATAAQRIKAFFVNIFPTFLSCAAILGIWQTVTSAGKISPRVLPSPGTIISSTVQTWPGLSRAIRVTAQESIYGFLIGIAAGIIIGIALYGSRFFYNAFSPILTAAQTLPIVTIAPIFIIWLGFESTAKIVTVAIFAIFPVAIQTCEGLREVPQFYTDVAVTCGATKTWTLWHVKMRVAATRIFSGIKIAAAYTVSTATAAEYMGAREGLGIWIQTAYNSFRTPLIFSATFIIIAMTAILLFIVKTVEKLMLR